MSSANIKHYLGRGIAADRPVSLDLAPATIGLWLNENDGTLDLWDGAAWNDDILAGDTALAPVSEVSIISGIARVDCLGGRRKHFSLALTGAATLEIANPAPAGYPTEIDIRIVSSGNYTLTIPSALKPLGGSDTAVAQGAGAVTRLSVVSYDAGASGEYAMQECGA